ncbi:hypothetical protein M9H77_10373 [Catharanthus roseus]|uniref:Uncharacterized protein n=1 Tax=Catharanthus roseus TaxID=4058 RepID=A0ACC0C3S8_CATRO|nr:hypothetical protein M9H77_10373 [Catharanthus roseus]
MKTSLKKLRGALRNERKDRRHHKTWTHLDEIDQATQDMKDTRDCYDRLLSAAAATANSVYESLGEMGDCLLEKTALSDDEETGEKYFSFTSIFMKAYENGERQHFPEVYSVVL